MSREEFIKKLRESAERLAKVMGCNHFETDKGTCGIWDEISKNVTMTEMLEAQYGDCSTEWTFTNDDESLRVQTRFRFSRPCISVKRTIRTQTDNGLMSQQDFIELEFSDQNIFVKGENDFESKPAGDFYLSQTMLWNNWHDLRDKLMDALCPEIREKVKF